jgi:methylaspartate ammonia-lyase
MNQRQRAASRGMQDADAQAQRIYFAGQMDVLEMLAEPGMGVSEALGIVESVDDGAEPPNA